MKQDSQQGGLFGSRMVWFCATDSEHRMLVQLASHRDDLKAVSVNVLNDSTQLKGWVKRGTTPSVIVADIEILGGELEMLQWIRSQEGFRTVPIVVLTSLWGGQNRGRAIELGARAVVSRPTTLTDFVTLLQNV